MLNKITNHIKENKKLYVGMSVGVVVGAAGAIILTRNNPQNVVKQINWRSPSNITQNNMITIPSRGNSGNIIQELATGIIYPSQAVAAKSLNINPNNLTRHLHGFNEHVSGYKFTKLVDGAASHEIQAV